MFWMFGLVGVFYVVMFFGVDVDSMLLVMLCLFVWMVKWMVLFVVVLNVRLSNFLGVVGLRNLVELILYVLSEWFSVVLIVWSVWLSSIIFGMIGWFGKCLGNVG